MNEEQKLKFMKERLEKRTKIKAKKVYQFLSNIVEKDFIDWIKFKNRVFLKDNYKIQVTKEYVIFKFLNKQDFYFTIFDSGIKPFYFYDTENKTSLGDMKNRKVTDLIELHIIDLFYDKTILEAKKEV